MAICTWCEAEMMMAATCNVDAFHRGGRRFAMIPLGREIEQQNSGTRCADCGVAWGGWHHPGCDLQQCPRCTGQLMSCGCLFDEDDDDDDLEPVTEPLGVDGNGLLTERMWMGEQEVIIHRDDVPETDITTVRGIPCTTALRTVIDVAPDVSMTALNEMVRDCLLRRLFTVEDAWRRLDQPDMATRRGAQMLRLVLPPPGAA